MSVLHFMIAVSLLVIALLILLRGKSEKNKQSALVIVALTFLSAVSAQWSDVVKQVMFLIVLLVAPFGILYMRPPEERGLWLYGTLWAMVLVSHYLAVLG